MLLIQAYGEPPSGEGGCTDQTNPAGLLRMHQAGEGPVALSFVGCGDQRRSATAAPRGQIVCSRSLVSTYSGESINQSRTVNHGVPSHHAIKHSILYTILNIVHKCR